MKQSKLWAAACAALFLLTPGLKAQPQADEVPFDETPAPWERRIHLGVRGGLNLAKLGGSNAYEEHDLSNKTGFHVGIIADVPLRVPGLWLQPGVYLSAKGTKAVLEETETYGNQQNYRREEQNMRMLFVEVPVLVSYHFDLGSEAQLQVSTGPYFAYGVDGKTSIDWERSETMFGNTFHSAGQTETKTFKYDAEAETEEDQGAGMKRFDMGWNIGAGVSFKQIYLGLSYELGFLNLCDEAAWGDDASLRTRTLQVSVGYSF